MTFKLVETSLDVQWLSAFNLIEKIVDEHLEHEKGKPIFLER